MTHMKRFRGIPMSKSMRGLCKEEDYTFLGTPVKATAGTPGGALEDDWRDGKEDRVRRRLQRERVEQERLREMEEIKKEQQQQWRSHIFTLSCRQEKKVQERLERLRGFREFQRKVLAEGEESGGEEAEPRAAALR